MKTKTLDWSIGYVLINLEAQTGLESYFRLFRVQQSKANTIEHSPSPV